MLIKNSNTFHSEIPPVGTIYLTWNHVESYLYRIVYAINYLKNQIPINKKYLINGYIYF